MGEAGERSGRGLLTPTEQPPGKLSGIKYCSSLAIWRVAFAPTEGVTGFAGETLRYKGQMGSRRSDHSGLLFLCLC